MHDRLTHIRDVRVLVVGDVMLDRYYTGDCSRISPEAPVPVVRINTVDDRAGGAGNVAVNIAALGASVHLIGCIGNDTEGAALKKLLQDAGVRTTLLSSLQNTTTKSRIIGKQQQMLRFDREQSPEGACSDTVFNAFCDALHTADVVICSDYNKGVCQDSARMIAAATARRIPVFVDPKDTDFRRYAGAFAITPNMREFTAATHGNSSDIIEKAHQLMECCAIANIVVTRSEDGIDLIEKNGAHRHFGTQAREVFDVTGAGDTVIAVLAATYAAGCTLPDAVKLANIAAGLVVGKSGTAVCTYDELYRTMQNNNAARETAPLLYDATIAAVRAAQTRGETVVMTNGCFDILHLGHIDYLQKARALGDRLLVAVNSDDSITRLKGTGRPIQPENTRAALLQALACVDWVTIFSDDTPAELIRQIRPDILVKGGDYTPDTVVGADTVRANGGSVRILDFIEGHSTSRIIEHIRTTQQ